MRDITQGRDENPAALFQGRLVEALRKYTNTNPNSPEGQSLLAVHFTVQAAPDVRRKLQKATTVPQTLVSQLLDTAFAVFNRNRAGHLGGPAG